MAVNTINLMTIILVFSIFFLTIFHANGNPIALHNCLIVMENYCGVKSPTALDCARAAIKFWRTELPYHDMQEYYVALYKKLKIGEFDTPAVYCHKKKVYNRQQCKDELNDYFTGERCDRTEQRNYAVYHAFFNVVLSCNCEEGINTRITPRHEESTHSYEDTYILLIQQHIDVKNNMDSPEEFCRIKYEPGYTKPPYGIDLNLNIFETEINPNALQDCFTAMEFYCEEEDPTPLACVKVAIMSWKSILPEYDVQIYYEALYEKLIISHVLTPSDFCHNKRKGSSRTQCKRELDAYFAPKRCSREELRAFAVHRAFFVFTNQRKESSTQATPSHQKLKPSFEDKYILSIQNDIQIMSDMELPKDFCRRKYEPDYNNQV